MINKTNIDEPCFKIGDHVFDKRLSRCSKSMIIVDIITIDDLVGKLNLPCSPFLLSVGNYFYILEAEDGSDIGRNNNITQAILPNNQICYSFLNLRLIKCPEYMK